MLGKAKVRPVVVDMFAVYLVEHARANEWFRSTLLLERLEKSRFFVGGDDAVNLQLNSNRGTLDANEVQGKYAIRTRMGRAVKWLLLVMCFLLGLASEPPQMRKL